MRSASTDQELCALENDAGSPDVESLKARIRALAQEKLDRKQKLRLATLANDAVLGDLSFRLLFRLAGARGKSDSATDAEKLQYARSLVSKDLLNEGIALHRTVDPKAHPMVNYYLARAYSRIWDYSSMVPALRAGLAHPAIQGRARLIHMYWLANAVFTAEGKRDEPDELLRESIRQATQGGFSDVRMWATEFVVAHHLWDHRWDEAARTLSELARLFRDVPGGAHELMLEKWRRILEINTSADKISAIRGLEELKSKYVAMGFFAQARNLDYYRALCFGDARLGARLYFGTPLPHFKRRVLRDLGLSSHQLPEYLDLGVGSGLSSDPIVVEAFDGSNSVTCSRLKSGSAPLRLLQALSADFYVPANQYELFGRVYPDERYIASSSALKISQLLTRLRGWLGENRLPLRIEERAGRYFLESDTPLAIRVRAPWAECSAEDHLSPQFRSYLSELRKKYGTTPLAAAQVQAALGISRGSALNLFRALISAQLTEKAGSGSNTRYLLRA